MRLVLLALCCLSLTAEAHCFHRSQAAKRSFAKAHPCPTNGKPIPSCPGYVIDHVVPLCAGGKDKPANMQWQTLVEAKAKDILERQQCKKERK